ncbi:MAG: serine hydrolase domain-containing protein, partial [Candidatus Limnocylindrales bacterium]
VATSEVTLITDEDAPRVEVAPAEVAPAAATGSVLNDKTRAKLQRIIDNQHANKRVAGLQVAVRLADGETWLGSAGKAEFGPDRALDDDDQLAIASITKTFVAALILQLADEGKIDLDAPFGTYFRDAPRKDKATVRQLLSHTSGIYNFWANPRYGEITEAWWQNPGAGGRKSRSKQWTYDEMMGLVRAGDFKPGEDYQYSNTNYLILGKVAEAVEGKPLHRMLDQRFFKPLGLRDTIYQPAMKPRPDAAHGHWDWGGGWTDHTGDSRYVPFMAAASIADAAGAMASTARDLSVWASALYGGDVLSDEMLAEMLTFERPGFYGLGAYPANFAGHRGVGHRGGIRGYESAMFHFPADGVTIVLLSNQGNWSTDAPMNKLVKAVLGRN